MQKNINCILMRTVAVLLMLVFLSTAMVTGRYARYITSASGEDSARVAKFDVDVTSDILTQTFFVDIDPSNNAENSIRKEFTVTNKSEVAVALKFTVNNKYNNLPIQIKNLVTDTIAPGKTATVPMEIVWRDGETNDKYIGMVDLLEISVQVTQID